MDVRRRFLEGEVSARGAEREAEVAGTRSRIDVARTRLKAARERVRRIEERVLRGAAREEEPDPALLGVVEAENRLEFIETKLAAPRTEAIPGGRTAHRGSDPALASKPRSPPLRSAGQCTPLMSLRSTGTRSARSRPPPMVVPATAPKSMGRDMAS